MIHLTGKNCKSTGVDLWWDYPFMGTVMLSMPATGFSSSREILTCPLSRYWKKLWEMSRKLNKISVFLIVSGSLYGRTSSAPVSSCDRLAPSPLDFIVGFVQMIYPPSLLTLSTSQFGAFLGTVMWAGIPLSLAAMAAAAAWLPLEKSHSLTCQSIREKASNLEGLTSCEWQLFGLEGAHQGRTQHYKLSFFLDLRKLSYSTSSFSTKDNETYSWTSSLDL